MLRRLTVFVTVTLLASDAAAQQCTSDPDEIVRALYVQLLEREPDRSARAMSYDIAASNRGSVRTNVQFVARSPEHQARFLWPPVVDAAFRATRGAAPSADLVAQVSAALARGQTTIRDVVAMFAAEEAQSRPPEQHVPILYARILGRAPDGNTAAQYAQVSAERGLLAVAQALVNSPEYRERFGANGVPVAGDEPYQTSIRILYRHLLGRDADSIGARAHARAAADHGFEAVIDHIVSSEEYMQRFGEHGVPGPRNGRLRYCGAEEQAPEPRRARPRWRD